MLLPPPTCCQLARPASNPPLRSRSVQPGGATVPVGVGVSVGGTVTTPVGVMVPVGVPVLTGPVQLCSETSSRNMAARPPRPSL